MSGNLTFKASFKLENAIYIFQINSCTWGKPSPTEGLLHAASQPLQGVVSLRNGLILDHFQTHQLEIVTAMSC